MRVKIEVGGVIVTDKQKKELEMLGFKISNENVKYEWLFLVKLFHN